MLFNYKYSDSKNKIFERHNALIKEMNIDVDLVLLGDSITEAFDLNRYAITNKSYINDGIGVDRLPYIFERLERDVLSHSPKEVIVMAGVNDIRAWYFEDNNELSDIDILIEHCLFYLNKICQTLKDKDIQVRLCSITCNHEQDNNFEYLNEIIRQVNKQIYLYTKKEKINLIDYNKVLANENGYMDLNLSQDGLHPNEYGYIKMGRLIKDYLIK
ncbi:MAG: SGNH/GDSL hydrolase family protein [Lactovum sp.]